MNLEKGNPPCRCCCSENAKPKIHNYPQKRRKCQATTNTKSDQRLRVKL